MARKLWKLKLGILLFVLLVIGGAASLFPLKVWRWEKVDSREMTLGMHWEKLPILGRFFPPPEEIAVEDQPTWELQVIARQRKELEEREAKYQVDIEKLRKVKDDIEKQRRELKKLRDELDVLIGVKEERAASQSSDQDKKAAANLAQLAKSYEKMDPAAAAKALSKMKDEDVIAIISNMRDKYVSRVIEAMAPERAAQISAGMIKPGRRGGEKK